MIYAENILICIAIPMLISLFFLRGTSRRFLMSFVMGMLACLLSAYISGFLNLASGMGPEDTAIFISPIVEEILKILPLLFALYLFQPEDGSLSTIALGTAAGFATFENCCYILSSGVDRLSYVLIRGMAVGVMHIVSVIAISMGIIAARRLKALTFPAILGALSLSATFHALYNLLVSEPGISSAIGYALPMLTAFVLYRMNLKLREQV